MGVRKARHQRTQQPNTTDAIVNLSNKKDSQQLKRRSSIRDCPLYRTRRRPNQDKSYTTSTNSKQIYTELYTKTKQPPAKIKPHTPTTIPPEPHTPSESERHQRGSRQNITNATETQRQPNIQTKTSPEKSCH